MERPMTEPLSSGTVCSKLDRIAALARTHPERVFQSVGHAIDVELLREAYRRTRKGGAPGIDGRTAQEYGVELDSNLQLLLNRMKSGLYHAPAVRRVRIPKGNRGEKRPIGIPTFEDKIAQRAVVMILEAIYEQDFLPCSYGFRPGRSAHENLQDLRDELMEHREGSWVLEVDIRGYFDAIDHRELRQVLDQRVTDGVLRRLIHKWLHAGVMEEGEKHYPESGAPQGGVISPLLANIFLHEVVDVWFARDVHSRLRGRGRMFRFADDIVMVFEREDDARRVMQVLGKRLGKYKLTLHPDKTRLIHFSPPREEEDDRSSGESFDFLGFTHYWARSRKGYWVVKQRTAKDRFARGLRRIAQYCRRHRHDPLVEQRNMLIAKLRGHANYYGVTGNYAAIARFYHQVKRIWFKWLRRRSRAAKRKNWEWFTALLERLPLPRPQAPRSLLRLSAKL